MNSIYRELKLLNNEDIVWLIYYFIITFAILSNKLERDNLFNKDVEKKKRAEKINTFILIVAFFIYLYFAYVSMDNFKNCRTQKEKRISFERLVVNFLFLVAGAIAI